MAASPRIEEREGVNLSISTIGLAISSNKDKLAGKIALNTGGGTKLTVDLRKGLGARRVALSAGLSEDGIAALREGIEGRIIASETLGGGAEEGEAGDELESVGPATHQVFERDAAGELVADGCGDFFVAGAEERVAQVFAGFRQIAEGIGARD